MSKDSLGTDIKDTTVQSEIMPFSALRTHGVLWAINRTLFHPRGYAMALDFETPEALGEPQGWTLLGDGSEQYEYLNKITNDQFTAFEALLRRQRR